MWPSLGLLKTSQNILIRSLREKYNKIICNINYQINDVMHEDS